MDMQMVLARRLGSGAAWRAARDADHPEEEGNRRSAEALDALAQYVTTLPRDDSRLKVIGGLEFRQDEFPGEGDDVDQLIARYGTNRHMQPHADTFLQNLVDLADHRTRKQRADRDNGK